jgi:hypothetical protein
LVKLLAFILFPSHHLSVLVQVLGNSIPMCPCLVLLYYLGEGNIAQRTINY